MTGRSGDRQQAQARRRVPARHRNHGGVPASCADGNARRPHRPVRNGLEKPADGSAARQRLPQNTLGTQSPHGVYGHEGVVIPVPGGAKRLVAKRHQRNSAKHPVPPSPSSACGCLSPRREHLAPGPAPPRTTGQASTPSKQQREGHRARCHASRRPPNPRSAGSAGPATPPSSPPASPAVSAGPGSNPTSGASHKTPPADTKRVQQPTPIGQSAAKPQPHAVLLPTGHGKRLSPRSRRMSPRLVRGAPSATPGPGTNNPPPTTGKALGQSQRETHQS